MHESEVSKTTKLLTQELLNKLPRLHANEEEEDPLVWVKFFFPDWSWTWYAIEFDGEDLFFGFVDGDFPELGCFRLSELLNNRGKCGLPIERDRYFTPRRLSVLRRQIGR